MYPRSNKSALLKAYAEGTTDPLARLFQLVGGVAFGLVPLAIVLADRYPGTKLWLGVATISFMTAPIMLIFLGARVRGIKNGIPGFGHQLWAVCRNATLYLLLPCALITLALIAYALIVKP